MALVRLKETEECGFELPEAVFDMDYPGQYMLRMQTLSEKIEDLFLFVNYTAQF
jgi:Tc toxin complex TcA C-terminal TcB-binding domain